MLVTLNERRVKETVLANAAQIRDTAIHFFPGNANTYGLATRIDVSEFADKGIHIFNAHDQSVNMLIYGDVVATGGTSGNFVLVTSESLAAGTKKWYGGVGYPALKDSFPYLVVQIQSPTTAPTAGDITIKFQGGSR